MNDILPRLKRVTMQEGSLKRIDARLAEQSAALAPFRSTLPEGSKGRWTIRRFTIHEPNLGTLQLVLKGGRSMGPGTYTSLVRDADSKENRTIVMSDTDAEIMDFIEDMHPVEGRVLVAGLGLGVAVRMLLMLDSVTRIDVVELDQDVIDLVGPAFANDPRVNIVQGDIFWHTPAAGITYDWAWYDIWDMISDENLPQMRKLRHRFQRFMARRDRQKCWAEHYCRQMAKGIPPKLWKPKVSRR